MTLQQRLQHSKAQRPTRPDNDPDMCRLQALWVRSKGSERGFEPVLRQFRNDPYAPLAEYIQRYNLHG